MYFTDTCWKYMANDGNVFKMFPADTWSLAPGESA